MIFGQAQMWVSNVRGIGDDATEGGLEIDGVTASLMIKGDGSIEFDEFLVGK